MPKGCSSFLIGNKYDMENKRFIKREEGNELAKSNNFIFFETSCLSYEGFSEPFNKILELDGRPKLMVKHKKRKKFCYC